MTGALGRVRSAALLLLVAAPLALAACAGSGYHYVKSTEDKTYFKVPESWNLYDEESILGALKGPSRRTRSPSAATPRGRRSSTPIPTRR